MKVKIIYYKWHRIEKRIDIRTHTALIYQGYNFIKGIAGNIYPDGSEDSIEKAKEFIDNLNM